MAIRSKFLRLEIQTYLFSNSALKFIPRSPQHPSQNQREEGTRVQLKGLLVLPGKSLSYTHPNPCLHLGCWPSLSRASGTPEHWLPRPWPSAQPCCSITFRPMPCRGKGEDSRDGALKWERGRRSEGMEIEKTKESMDWVQCSPWCGAQRCPPGV